jgi:nitroreductase
MSEETANQKNIVLDEIIANRRTHRKFKQIFPPENDIIHIINAGLHAPFAGAATRNTEDFSFRRFFVLKSGSKSMTTASSLIFEEVSTIASKLERAMENDSQLCERASWFVKRLAMFKNIGKVPGVGTAPYFIVVAEKKGFPPVEQ